MHQILGFEPHMGGHMQNVDVQCHSTHILPGIIAYFKIQYKKKLLQWVLSQYDDATLKDLRKVVPNIKHIIM
jgi:hypothetical protein